MTMFQPRYVLIACGLLSLGSGLSAEEQKEAPGLSAQTSNDGSFSPMWHDEMVRLNESHRTSIRTRNHGPTIADSRALLTKIAETSGEHSTDFAAALSMHAMHLNAAGRPAEALPLLARALPLSSQLFGERHRATLSCLHRYGFVLRRLGHDEAAAPYLELATRLRTETLGEADGQTMLSRLNYAHALFNLKRFEEAAATYGDALRIAEQHYGRKHHAYVSSRRYYAASLRKLGRHEEAGALMSREK